MQNLYRRCLGSGWCGQLLALLAGLALPLSFAPWNLWPVAIVSVALLALGLEQLNGRQALARSFCFGLGMYLTGVSWVYISINNFGQAPAPLAALLTALFAAGLALVFGLPFALLGRFGRSQRHFIALLFPATWLLGEWFRGWFLTGFPWLYLGYGHLDSPLAGWAPVTGVMGISLIVAFTAATLALLLKPMLQQPAESRTALPACILIVLLLWGAGPVLKQIAWTHTEGEAIRVGLVQPNIPQEKKWRPEFLEPTLERLRRLSDPLWHNDWVIWPEAAVPKLYHRAGKILDEFDRRASATDTGLLTGILYDDYRAGKYYNTVVGLGRGLGLYQKTRLVPFGEYVPLEQYLRGLIKFFNLPTSIISPGVGKQRGVQVGAVMVMPSICYEIAYPAQVARGARDGDVLLTVSNDAWFGDSIGPLQHMQIAQMRALETGRYLIRATNNGRSGIIDPRGNITATAAQFEQASIEGEVFVTRGLTPYVSFGNTPLLWLIALMLAGGLIRRRRAIIPDSSSVSI